ncbi:CAMK family protein kinase [Tritrichomonas foetus]|uniref:CAMK family protein kinase n=1 Tax=Tritrichomonas foetus TaxID=1144522 RepID=A0A1J4J6K9_9EUKA|nr:CAMK family protein kinase [Tritrichomonas foetus]|eukprot:OHS92812.1 CAMK family protein kinase [Tritrichomonas foetus]
MSNFRASLAQHGYELLEKIGEGNFAVVYLAKHLRFNLEFVCKIIKSPTEFDDSEIKHLCALDHQNIIRIYDYFRDNSTLYIILEYCPEGSLQDRIEHFGPLEYSFLVSCTKQTLQGLQHCHQYNIAHEDIKPANLFVGTNNRCKLGDFGLSQVIHYGEMKNKFNGSRAFAAPEFINSKKYDPFKADIWALGVTCFMLAEGRIPWDLGSIQELLNSILKCDLQFSDDTNPLYRDLIQKMLTVNPEERPSIDGLLSHPVFNISLKQSTSVDCKTSEISRSKLRFNFNRKMSIPITGGKKFITGSSVNIIQPRYNKSSGLLPNISSKRLI